MEITIPDKLAALSHPRRLDVFRLLMRRYPDAVPAGEITDALDIKPSTASVYLSALKAADLITQSREGTSLRYAADLDSLRGLFGTLLQDCCQNRPDLCLPQGGLSEEKTMSDRPMNVLFICTGNSARSIMAEAILRTEGGARFNAYSAGTHPGSAPHPFVVELLDHKGHDVAQLASKSTDLYREPGTPEFDFVFTVCDRAANEECPAWPGQPISAHWGQPDPVKATGTEAQKKLAFQQAYGVLKNRISAFVNLPWETLDRISLQHRLDDIGRTGAK